MQSLDFSSYYSYFIPFSSAGKRSPSVACVVWLFKLFKRVYEGLSMMCAFLLDPTILPITYSGHVCVCR